MRAFFFLASFAIVSLFSANCRLVKFGKPAKSHWEEINGEKFLDIRIKNRMLYTFLSKFVFHEMKEAVGWWINGTSIPSHGSPTHTENQYQLLSEDLWIELPSNWPSPKKSATSSDWIFYNAYMFWRFHAFMRHKATITPQCWNRLAVKNFKIAIIQIYHDPGEPYKIPCYICNRMMVRNGFPKIWYRIENRFLFQSFDSSNNSYVRDIIDEKLSVNMSIPIFYQNNHTYSEEWFYDQTFNDNLPHRGGDALYVNPSMNLAENVGTFYCKDYKHYKSDKNLGVIVNVDVMMKNPTDDLKLLPEVKDIDYSDNWTNLLVPPNKEKQIKCQISWEEWACPTFCDINGRRKTAIRTRKGYASVFNLNISADIPLLSKFSYLQKIFRLSPFAERGIPIYSSFWLRQAEYQHFTEECRNAFKHLVYIDSKSEDVTCADKVRCEMKMKDSVEYTLVEDRKENTYQVPEVDRDFSGPSSGCPMDIKKHHTVILNVTHPQKIDLLATENYRFVCENENVSKRGMSVVWTHGKGIRFGTCEEDWDMFVQANELHFHRVKGEFKIKCNITRKRHLYELNVALKVQEDDRLLIVSGVLWGLGIFLTCPLCLWCGRGVKDVTKASFEMAKMAAVAAADMQTGGMAGQMIGGTEEKQRQKEEEKQMRDEQLIQQRLAKKAAALQAQQAQQNQY